MMYVNIYSDSYCVHIFNVYLGTFVHNVIVKLMLAHIQKIIFDKAFKQKHFAEGWKALNNVKA